jgi:hypothetical protein
MMRVFEVQIVARAEHLSDAEVYPVAAAHG